MGQLRHRIEGAAMLLLGGGRAYLILQGHFLEPKALLAAPLLASTGAWMLAFGYPKRADGMAPGWWRLGLITLAIAATAATMHFAVPG